MREAIVSEGQNILDLAVQYYGNIEAVFDLIDDNPDVIVNLDYVAKAGDKILIDETKIINKDVVKYFTDKNIRINNGQEEPAGDFNDDFNDDFNI